LIFFDPLDQALKIPGRKKRPFFGRDNLRDRMHLKDVCSLKTGVFNLWRIILRGFYDYFTNFP